MSVRMTVTEFWDCLSAKQRKSLLCIHKESALALVKCRVCHELLHGAVTAIENACKHESLQKRQHVSMKLYRRPDNHEFTTAARIRNTAKKRDAVPDETTEYVNTCEYFRFQNFRFSVKNHTGPVVEELLSLRAGRDDTYFGDETVPISLTAGSPAVTRTKCWYCWNKLTVTIVDMLTYPRPIRKFKLLICKDDTLGDVRLMMVKEVGLRSASELVLMTRGKTLAATHDNLTFEELLFENNQKLVVSKVLGPPGHHPHDDDDDDGSKQRNRQFVGDLLFGHAATTHDCQTASTVVEQVQMSHGYQLLGHAVLQLLTVKIKQAWLAEKQARVNELALLEEMEMEEIEKQQNINSKKQKKKKRKKKRQQKKRNEDTARKLREEQEETRAEANRKRNHKRKQRKKERRAAMLTEKQEKEAADIDRQQKLHEAQQEQVQTLRMEMCAEQEGLKTMAEDVPVPENTLRVTLEPRLSTGIGAVHPSPSTSPQHNYQFPAPTASAHAQPIQRVRGGIEVPQSSDAQARRCPGCRVVVAYEANFCSNCGTQQQHSGHANYATQTRPLQYAPANAEWQSTGDRFLLGRQCHVTPNYSSTSVLTSSGYGWTATTTGSTPGRRALPFFKKLREGEARASTPSNSEHNDEQNSSRQRRRTGLFF